MTIPERVAAVPRGGFARLEVVLSLSAFVLATSLGLLLLSQFQQRRRCDRFMADLREFSAVFQNSIPPDSGLTASGDDTALPAAIEGRLRATNWFKGSPFGGNYGWVAEYPARLPGRKRPGTGAIALTAFAPSFPLALSPSALQYIDATLDDGNLAGGRFRTGFNGWPVYLVGDKP